MNPSSPSRCVLTRDQYETAFFAAIDRQMHTLAHTPGWKPLIELVWEELEKGSLVTSEKKDVLPLTTIVAEALEDAAKSGHAPSQLALAQWRNTNPEAR